MPAFRPSAPVEMAGRDCTPCRTEDPMSRARRARGRFHAAMVVFQTLKKSVCNV